MRVFPCRNMRRKNESRHIDNPTITKKELQQLAVLWKLSQQPDFWKLHPSEDDLLRVLHKHAKKLRESGTAAPFIEAHTTEKGGYVLQCTCLARGNAHAEVWFARSHPACRRPLRRRA
ncbi:hypothetical protein EON67_12455 [archaeon]|nr:MAG: hypothetical protein EON67_12455 [archaeon]